MRRRLRRLSYLLVGLSLLFLSACANHPSAPTTPSELLNNYDFVKAKLRWLIEKEINEQNLSGLSIALVNGDSVVWQEGFGYADKKNKLLVTPATRFRAGSLAKPLNAIALLRLEDQNKLSLDRPIHDYLAGFTPPSRFQTQDAITAKLCLSHLSGLPSDLIKGMWAQDPQTFSASLDYINTSYVAAAPNTVFRYSNLAHNLLAAVIEKQSGQTYQEHMRELLTLLKMPNSEFAAKAENLAQAYDKGKLRKVFNLRDVPAAGLVTNAQDLAQLLVAFNQFSDRISHESSQKVSADILSAKSWNKMRRDYSGHLPLNLGKRHGLGLIFYDGLFHSSVEVLGHGGASVNHRALIKFIPRDGLGVAILSNSKNSSGSLHKIANEALSHLLQAKHGKPAPKNMAAWPQKSSGDIVTPERLLGHYATAGGMAKIFNKGDKFKVTIAGRTIQLYQREPGGLFYLQYKLLGLWPIDLGYFSHLAFALRNIEGKEYLISKNTHGLEALIGPKITPKDIPHAWRKRVGQYRVLDPLEAVELPSGGLKIEDEFLVAYATTDDGDKLSVVLEALNDKEAVVSGIGRGLGETVTVVNKEGAEALYFSGLHFLKKSDAK